MTILVIGVARGSTGATGSSGTPTPPVTTGSGSGQGTTPPTRPTGPGVTPPAGPTVSNPGLHTSPTALIFGSYPNPGGSAAVATGGSRALESIPEAVTTPTELIFPGLNLVAPPTGGNGPVEGLGRGIPPRGCRRTKGRRAFPDAVDRSEIADARSVTVDWGDGTIETLTDMASITQGLPTHVYVDDSGDGAYLTRLTIVHADGSETVREAKFKIADVAPRLIDLDGEIDAELDARPGSSSRAALSIRASSTATA